MVTYDKESENKNLDQNIKRNPSIKIYSKEFSILIINVSLT